MVDTTIRIGLEMDGSQVVKEFENVATASDAVVANMKKIRSEADTMMPETQAFFDKSELSVQNSFSRIDAINKQIDSNPIFSEHQLENLYAEREMLRRGIETTIHEMQQFASSSVGFIRSFNSKKGGTTALQSVTRLMPNLMTIVRQVADFQRESDTLMDAATFKAGIKNKIAEAGLIGELGFEKNSKSMDQLAEYLMLKGTDQTQRKSFMSRVASGYEKKKHIYDSFSDMLPAAFKAFHASKGTLAGNDDVTQLSISERRQIADLLKTNPFFMQAAEASGVGRRMNGAIEIRSGITRGMINRLAGNLYDTIVSSAKGMPMYGITDVDDPQFWDRISRKSNKPFLGSMNSARVLSDNFSWLRPTVGGTYKDTNATYTPLIDNNGKPVAVPFSPNIKRYEVANYTLEDLQKNIDLNRDRSQIYGQTTGRTDQYISIDHSARLENIFRHRKNGAMPKNNDVVDDFLFLQLDKRFEDPNLDEKVKEKLMDEYASYIDNGITKIVNGKNVHFSFTRAHKGLGLEFVQDEIFNAMAPIDPKTGERDLSAFWGGIKFPKISVKDKHLNKEGKLVNYTPEEVFNIGAKFVEYASKDATSGESIESLYGTVLPENLKIGIFDLEEAAKKQNPNQLIPGAGMNGTSYISKRLVPGGFQARMPGIKTALNTIDFGGFLSHFGGSIKTIGPDGRIEEITPDLDLLISLSDIKNAGIRYQDDKGNLLPTAEIAENIRQEIKQSGGKIFANKTMNDAQGGINWMSRQFSQILANDPEFVDMTTKAFLDEYERVGTLEGALDTVFASDSEMRDLILSTHGAIMSDRKIQDRIHDFRTGMMTKISQGDTILPRELETSRAMAQPWFFNAVISGMKRINSAGTGLVKEGEKSYFDALLEDPSRMSQEQKNVLGMITMENDEVAFKKIMAMMLGVGRYPATSRSARQAMNVLADGSNRAKAMKKALETSGFDPNAFYISPSSPLMQLLQDADFDGDVMDLIGLAYSGKDKDGKTLKAAEVFQRVYERGMEKIDQMGLSEDETNKRKEQFSKAVFQMNSFDATKGKDVLQVTVPAKQGGYFMGGPDAVVRNAMQIPWTESVTRAIADAESQYSVNSVRNKQGIEMSTTPEQMELLSKYRTFTEFFHAVNKNRDEFGNVDIPRLAEAMRGSDGLSGAKFWATNLPFHTMSPNVRTMMLSRYFAKRRGIDINEGYDWNYIFDSILGKKDESTALGRMQSGLRDAWMGYLNADYLALDEESVAKLGELRKLAVDEEAAKVKVERSREGSYSFGQKGSNRAIAERLVDRLGGNVIKNAVAGMAMTEAHLEEGETNSGIMKILRGLNMPGIVGGIDISKLLTMKTTPQTFEEMSATTKSTQLARTLDVFNLLTQREKQNRIDNMPRLSFSTLAKLAYNPEEFMKDIVTGRENNASLPATEIGQAAHTAIEHFMRARMDASKNGGLDENGLATAQQEALKVFDQYLGVQKAPSNFHREGRGLTDSERTRMLTPGDNLNERYERLKSFIGGKGLLEVFPEKDWEVIGIESSNVGDNGERTGKGNMKIPSKGKKILTPTEDVEMTGSYDLLFRNKNDGRVVMGDLKNYWDPTARDWEKWKVQQAIYASQLKKNGFKNIASTIIEPYQNRQRNIDFTDYDFMQSDENVEKAIKAIQGLAKNGDTTVKDVYAAAKFVRETLFGDVQSSVGDQIADRYNRYSGKGRNSGGASVRPGVITDALWMHDRYNEAIENDEDIHKFINKETRNKDSVYTIDKAWRSKYTQAQGIHEAAVQQEKAGQTAQAKDLDARFEAAIRDLDNNMGVALINHITNFADSVRSSIDGQSGTKEIQSAVNAFKDTKNQQSGLEKSIELFKERIEETKQREDAIDQSITQLNESDTKLAKDESVYDKLIQYTKEALGKTDDTKGISSKSAAGKRAARTKLLNANSHIRDNSLFAPILQLLDNGNEEAAIDLMEKRKSELTNIRKENKTQIEQKKTEKAAENFQKALMNDQLLKAQDLLNTTAPLTDLYLEQLTKSATTSLENSFISLARVTDKNVRIPFNTKKARTDFVNAVGNSLQDASSLYEAGMINESDFMRYKLQADTLLKEENLSKVEHEAIAEAKRRLGMETTDKRGEWLNARKQVLEAERDLKTEEARKEYMDQFKEDRKTDPHVRLRDYKEKYDSSVADINKQYESDLKAVEDELNAKDQLLIERTKFSNEMALRQRDRQYAQYERGRFGSLGRFAQYYLGQQNIASSLRDQRDTAEFNARTIQNEITSGKYIGDSLGLKNAQLLMQRYKDEAAKASTELQKFGKFQNVAASGVHALSDAATMLLRRFGRQLFSKALQEAKKFVQEFNQQMTTIQMITLKSNEEMSTLGDGLIDKAKELKISVSEIAQSAATLYRQGLNDQEVSERLDVISKFSKVSGTKVDAATKLITVAMNTGLVSNPQMASDIVTALGDNAATNAAEIEKGIEKAGAAAAADGTTFAQLASMLTAITSTTQIGGNVAGRTLNTIFGRMNKIGTNELIYDENGNAVSGSAVSKLLAAQGIRTYDENGNKRSSYDVLYDLSQKWNSLEDASQQMLASQIAGTRQYSNFSAIMQGMAEGKVDEYMQLAGNAEGITDKKYEIYTQSLLASLTDLKNTFDALVDDLVDKGYVQEFVSGISTMINGVDNLVNSLGGLQMALPVVMALVGALSGLKFGGLGALIGAVIGLGSFAGLTALGQNKTYDLQEINFENRSKQISSARTTLQNAQDMYESYKNGGLSSEDIKTFDKLVSDLDASLSDAFSETERTALGLSGSFVNVGAKLDAYAAALDARTKIQEEQRFRKRTSTDLSDIIASRYENGDGKTYTDEEELYNYLTENFSEEDGYFAYGLNGLDTYMRNAAFLGATSKGTAVPGTFLDTYSDRIKKWIEERKFVQGYKRNGDELIPIPYTNIEDLYKDFATGEFTDSNGIPNQNDTNLRTLFELIIGAGGDAAYKENVESQTAFARDIISNTYGDRLKQSLLGLSYVDDNLASLVTDAYIDSIMQGVKGEIDESNAVGGNADIPGVIASEGQRLVNDMYGMLLTNDPLNALQEYAIVSKRNNTEFLEKHKDVLKGLSGDELDNAIRGILFPSPTTLAEEEAKEIAQDVLHAGAATGYATWSSDKSNAYSLAADAMLRKFASANVSDMQSLHEYLQTTDGKEWKYLVENNGDLARLVSSVQYDNEGNFINPGVYDQIIDTLLANSKTRGARLVPNSEKITKAQAMYSSIARGDKGYLSWEDALADATIEAQASINSYDAGINAVINREREELRSRLPEKELDAALKARETQLRTDNPYSGQTAEQIAAGYRIYTKEEQEYLKAAVGDKMYARIIDAYTGGKPLTDEEKRFNYMALTNASYGRTSLSNQEQLAGLKEVRENIDTLGLENGYSRDLADTYMSSIWDEWNLYAQLIEAKNKDIQEDYDDAGGDKELERLTKELDTIQKEAEIKIELDGLRTLERAGELAEGTADAIEKLRKGGKVALEINLDITNSAYSTGQLRAKLTNGTELQQDEVIMTVLGLKDKADLYATDTSREEYKAQTESALAITSESDAEQIYEYYNYAKTDEDRQRYLNALTQYGYAVTSNGLEYTGYIPEIKENNVSPLAGRNKEYTASELADMRLNILENGLSKKDVEDKDLYDAAINSMSEIEKRAAEGNSAYRERALNIARKSQRDAREQQELEELETAYAEDTMNAHDYAVKKFEIQNKAALAAEAAYANRNQYTNVEDFMMAARNVENWNEVEASQEWLDISNKYLDSNGHLKQGVTLDQFYNEFSNLTMYSKSSGYASRQELARQAREALASSNKTATNPNRDAIRQILGDEIYGLWETGTDFTNNENINRQLRNYELGISGLSATERMQGIEDITTKTNDELKTYLESPENLSAADEIMSGFDRWNEYKNAILTGQTDTEEFKVLLQDLETFKRDSKIRFDLQGEESLERAGELLEGTVDALEKLKKGGKVALDVVMNIDNNMYSTGQLRAKLASNNINDQDEAIMAYTGATLEQLYATETSRSEYLARAEQAERLDSAEKVKQLVEEFEEAEPQYREELRRQAAQLGYEIYDDGGYRYIGSTPSVTSDTQSSLVGRKPEYTDTELADMRLGIVEGRIKKTETNKDLYEAALATMTEEEKRVAEGRPNANRDYAINIAREAKRTTDEQKRLDELEKARNSSPEAAYNYGLARYEMDNKAALAAEAAYAHREGHTDLASFMDMATELTDWNEVASSQGWIELTNRYLDSEGNLKSGVSLEDFYDAFAGLTMYSQSSGYVSRKDNVRRLREALTSTDRSALNPNAEILRQVIGDDAYDRWLKNEDLTNDENVQRAIRNYTNNVSAITAKERISGINRFSGMSTEALSTYLENELNQQYADEIMSGFSGWEEYKSMIKNGQTNTEEFRILQQELDTFRKNSQIEFEVSGTQALEEAGDLLAGTTDMIRKLKQEGKVAIDVMVDYRAQSFTAGQQRAKLYKGTRAEQNEAAMAYLNMSRDEFYLDEQGNLLAAKDYDASTMQTEAESIMKMYAAQKTVEGQQAIIRDAAMRGFKWDNGRFVFDESLLNVANTSPFTGASQGYTDAQLANARLAMINGESISDELMTAASSGMGYYENEYMRQLTAYNEGVEGATKPTEELRRLAQREAEMAKQAADEEEEARLKSFDTDTTAGVFSYAKYRYEQGNKAQVAAENLFEAFNNVDADNIDAIMGIMSDENHRKDWEELLSSAPELTKEFKDAGHAVTDEGQIDWEAIKDQEDSLDEALADLVRIISNHSSELQGSFYDTRSDVYANAQNYLKTGAQDDYDDYAAVVGQDIAARDRATDYTLNDLEQWYKDTRLENYGNGIDGLTEVDRLQGAKQILGSIANGTYDTNTSTDVISDVSGAVDGLEDLIQAYLKGQLEAEDFAEMQKDVNAKLLAGQYAASNYGDTVDDVTQSLQKLAKGGKTARQELTRIREATYDTQDKMTAWDEAFNGGKVKSGKQMSKQGREAIAKEVGVAADTIKKWTSEEMAANFANEGTRADINEEMGTYVDTLLNDALNDIRTAVGHDFKLDEKIDIGGTVDIVCNPDGTINMAGLIALANAAQSDAISVLEALAQGKLAEWVATLKTSGEGENFKAWIEAQTNTFAKKNSAGKHSYNSRGGGSSGGGGKSELDKTLERIKHQIGEIEHAGKILQTLYEGLDFVNDYSGMGSNIDQQIENQERLRAAYASSIAELQAQLASLQAGTDDWYKASEAIWQYQEALAAVNNTINQLRSAKITILEQKHEYASGPKNHKGTILDKRAQRYQITGQFEAYETTVQQSIENSKAQIDQNKKQIKEWENLLKETIKNSDDWYKIRDKIWAKKEENEQLQNDIIQAEIELDKARIDQIAKELSLATINYEHMNNMFDTFAGMYESTYNFEKYRKAMQDQSSNLIKIKEENDKAIEKMKSEIENMDADDPAREYAVQMLHQLEEQNAQIEAELLQNQQAIEESYISEIQHNYDERLKELEHEGKLLDQEYAKFERNQDYSNQENIYNEKARNISDELRVQQEQLESLEELLASGKITEGSQQWFDLRDLIRSVTEAIADLDNQLTSTTDKLMETHFEHIMRNFKEGYTDEEGNIVFEGMDQIQHERNLIGYQKTKYQNRGELQNVGIMLEADRDRIEKQRNATIDQINNLKAFKDTVKDIPQLYDKVTDEIKTQEEALAKYTNELEQTTKAIEKNTEAIRQARIKVENEADKAIRSIIQKQRNMLAATVQIQNNILENIRNYYREQWDLQKKTIDKEKQALNEEKNLLTEQLNFKRKMMDQESKEEELAEYKRQLALISADTTRSKDANELRRKISEMEKEMAIQTAQDIANAESKSIDDRIKGWDNYVSVQEEDLNNMLANSNNFRETIDQLMSGSFEDFVAWNASINKNYINATEEQRAQMEQGWDDTWLNMLGMIRTYWDEVDEASRSRDGFLSLLRSTDDYQKLSDTGKESYLYNMGEMWDNFYKAYNIKDADFSDSHEILNTLSDMKDWTFTVKLSNPQDLYIDTTASSYFLDTNHRAADKVANDLYTGWGVDPPPPAPDPPPAPVEPTPPSTPKKTFSYYSYVDASATIHKKIAHYSDGSAAFVCNENHTWKGALTNGTTCSKCGHLFGYYTPGSTKPGSTKPGATPNTNGGGGGNNVLMKYASGGLVDYTGPAWVDGSKTRPEAFLDPDDTALLRAMLDQFTYVKNSPFMTNVDTSKYGNTNISVGDVNVNLYEAKLEDNADYDLIAQKVGNAFTKQLQKDGFNLAGYNW